MVMLTLVMVDDPAYGNHWFAAERPTLLVCSVQPRLVGHAKLNVLPETETCITGALVFTVAGTVSAVMEPSTARLFCHVAPAPVTVIAAPFDTAWLNRVNVSPTARAGPRFDTVSVPVPVLVSTPVTTTKSLDSGVQDLFTSKRMLPPMIKSLLIVSIPSVEPGANVVPGPSSMTGPESVPVPPSVPNTTSVERAVLLP